jgi:hypothetical protein
MSCGIIWVMAHHAFFTAGDLEASVLQAESFAERALGLSVRGNPDVITLRYSLFSVDDARRLREIVYQTEAHGKGKVVIVSAGRIFHEAQNVLLKVCEEPPAGTVLILAVPQEGILLPTLRSRLQSLPGEGAYVEEGGAAIVFLNAPLSEREKIIEKLLARSRSDNDDEKQAARLAVLVLLEGLLTKTYDAMKAGNPDPELPLFASDVDRFLPILSERAAPLKLVLEHVLLTLPESLESSS